MPLFIECPSGHRLKVPSKLAGHSIVCPVCDEKISVPPLAAPPKPMLRPVNKRTQPVAAKPKSEPVQTPAPQQPKTEQPETEQPETKQPETKQPSAEQPQVKQREAEQLSFPDGPAADAPTAASAAPPQPIAESPTPTPPQPRDVDRPPFQLDLPSDGGQVTQRIDHQHSLRPPTSPQPIEDDYDRPYVPEFPVEAPDDEAGIDDIPEPTEQYGDYDAHEQVAYELEDLEQSNVDQYEGPASEAIQSYENDQVTWIQVDTEPAPKESRTSLRDNQYFGVLALGIAAIMVAVFCAIPSVIDQVLARQVGINAPDNWTYLVLLSSLVQVAVAIYAMRLPDWSTSWIASITATAFAAMYALGLALTMFASQEHQLVQELGLLDEAFHYQAQPWCFLVMCITLILAFCYGRFSLRWYHLEKQLAHVG